MARASARRVLRRRSRARTRPPVPPFSPIPSTSQRDNPMLLRGILIPLVFQVPQRANQLAPGVSRTNHLIDEAAAGGDVGIRELLTELLDLFRSHPDGIGGG